MNCSKSFSSGIFQTYLVFKSARKCIRFVKLIQKLILGNLMGCQKTTLNLLLQETKSFLQHGLIIIHSYTIDSWSKDLNTDFTLNNCLCRSLELTKNADPDKYRYSDQGIKFYSCSEFSLTDGSMTKNVIIFGVDVSSSAHVHKNK